MILAAHPDDDILGCGGFLSKIKDTDINVKVIFIAEGTSCRYQDSTRDSDEVKKEILSRTTSGLRALKFLGVTNTSFYNLPCGRLDSVPIIEINKIIESEIQNFQPDTIFTHSGNDANNDHKIVFNSTIMATRPIPGQVVKSIYSYEVLSSSEWNFGGNSFSPNFFIELEERHLQAKIDSLKHYASELRPYPFPRSEEGVRMNSMYRGMQAGLKYAESFRLLRGLFK